LNAQRCTSHGVRCDADSRLIGHLEGGPINHESARLHRDLCSVERSTSFAFGELVLAETCRKTHTDRHCSDARPARLRLAVLPALPVSRACVRSTCVHVHVRRTVRTVRYVHRQVLHCTHTQCARAPLAQLAAASCSAPVLQCRCTCRRHTCSTRQLPCVRGGMATFGGHLLTYARSAGRHTVQPPTVTSTYGSLLGLSVGASGSRGASAFLTAAMPTNAS